MPAQEQADPKTVLVVDDTPSYVDLLVGLLSDKYQIKVALSGKKALDIANSPTPPDLILLDIMTPEMDGYEVCRRLKDDPNTNSIPVLFLSAETNKSEIEKGLKLGAIAHITKRINAENLLRHVMTQLAV